MTSETFKPEPTVSFGTSWLNVRYSADTLPALAALHLTPGLDVANDAPIFLRAFSRP